MLDRHVEEMALVAQAAERDGVVPIINRLPKGYETLLGRTFEESVDLSGGEWQKLALSRAFMREAQLLILDEPTAAYTSKHRPLSFTMYNFHYT